MKAHVKDHTGSSKLNTQLFKSVTHLSPPFVVVGIDIIYSQIAVSTAGELEIMGEMFGPRALLNKR